MVEYWSKKEVEKYRQDMRSRMKSNLTPDKERKQEQRVFDMMFEKVKLWKVNIELNICDEQHSLYFTDLDLIFFANEIRLDRECYKNDYGVDLHQNEKIKRE